MAVRTRSAEDLEAAQIYEDVKLDDETVLVVSPNISLEDLIQQ
jgi:hypothetical protein